jgi:hypothetical protein
MNEFNTYEIVVAQKKAGKVKGRRMLAVAGYVLFFLAIFTVLCVLHIPQFVAILPILEWVLIFFTWRYLSQEYEYSMTSGYMTFTVIYGGRSKKKKLEVCIKDMKEIAPYDEAACARLESRNLKKDYLFISSLDAPDMYYAVFDQDGEDQVVYFEATKKALQILRFYNPVTVVTEVSR